MGKRSGGRSLTQTTDRHFLVRVQRDQEQARARVSRGWGGAKRARPLLAGRPLSTIGAPGDIAVSTLRTTAPQVAALNHDNRRLVADCGNDHLPM